MKAIRLIWADRPTRAEQVQAQAEITALMWAVRRRKRWGWLR
jgi:ABC-type dipeptide/oligopeptide/nickel transport system ATPase component